MLPPLPVINVRQVTTTLDRESLVDVCLVAATPLAVSGWMPSVIAPRGSVHARKMWRVSTFYILLDQNILNVFYFF